MIPVLIWFRKAALERIRRMQKGKSNKEAAGGEEMETMEVRERSWSRESYG